MYGNAALILLPLEGVLLRMIKKNKTFNYYTLLHYNYVIIIINIIYNIALLTMLIPTAFFVILVSINLNYTRDFLAHFIITICTKIN